MELLDTADVRFDFSQYTDIDNMFDVNNNWGPMKELAVDSSTKVFTAQGLKMTTDGVSVGQSLRPGLIDPVTGPLVFGPNGLTMMNVVHFLNDFNDTVASRMVTSLLQANSIGGDGTGYPQGQTEWGMTTDISASFYDSEPTEDLIADLFEDLSPRVTRLAGTYITIYSIDVPAEELRTRLIGPSTDLNYSTPFTKIPDYIAEPWFIDDLITMTAIVFTDTISVISIVQDEWLGWNQVLTTEEINSLIAHFTQDPEQGETSMPGPHDDQNIQHEVDVEQSVRDDLERTGQVAHTGTAITNANVAHALNSTFSDTEGEAALNALGVKINAILAVLRANGIIAT